MKRILLFICVFALFSVQYADAQCNITNTGTSPSPTNCNSLQFSGGAGESRTLINTGLGYYTTFSIVNNGQTSGFCVNGTRYTANTNFTWNGNQTIGMWRANGTWNGSSASFRYDLRTPTQSANATGNLTICVGGSANITRGNGPTASRQSTGVFWQGTNAGGTSTANSGTTYNTGTLNTVGTFTFYFRPLNKSCWGTASGTTVTVVADPVAPATTKNPNVTTVCTGASLDLTINSNGSGGTGCVNQFRFQQPGGSYTAWVTGTNPPAITAGGTGTFNYQYRRNCSGSGCSDPVVTQSWTVVADPTSPTITRVPNVATVCEGQSLDIAISGGSGGTGCTNQYRYSTNNGSTWSAWSTSAPAFTAVVGTNLYQSRRTCSGSGCGTAASNQVSWTVVADPTSPTITRVPNVATVCEGQSLDIAISGGSGGTGCTNQYRYSTNNGSTWSAWSTSAPAFTAVVGTNLYQSRRTCSGSGCGTAASNQVSWNVLPSSAVGSVSGTSPLCIGATATYTVSGVVLSGGTGAWSSSNTGVATVNAAGVVTGVAAGSANIIYTVTGGCNGPASAQQSVTITPDAAVGSVSGTSPLCIGATATYTASGVVLSGGTGAWSSSNTGVATVNAAGVVTGVAAGTANIIYTVTGGCNSPASAQQSVTVLPVPVVGLVSGTSPLCIGESATYLATGLVLGGGTGAWSSSNTGVATVTAAGLVTGVSAGSANIIYTITGPCGTSSAQQAVTITPSSAVGSVSGTSPLCIGASATYTTSGVVLGGGTGAWSSSNTGVATVDAAGLVTGVAAGSADIIYTVSGGCNGPASAQQSVTINPDAAITAVNGPSELCLSGTATFTTSGEVLGGGSGAWSSSNTGVATVNASGVVTAVAGGTTNIVYTITGGCGGTVSAQQALSVTTAANSAVLVSGSTVSAVASCVEAPWTYYANASTPDEYIFAIRKNGNTFVANVEIVDQSGTATYSSTGGAGPDRGTFLIGRHWNVTLASGSVVTPVDIRFFVDPAEVTQAQTEANAFQGTTAFATTVVGLSFFKTVGTPYSPGMMGGGNFTFTPEYLSHSTGTLNGVTYYELTGLTSFSGGTGGFSVNDNGATLPVELLSWEANAINNELIELAWSTATEINNDRFEIQRSTDGENFEDLATEAGNGNSSSVINYTYQDREVSKGVRYYYRLKQIDNDGTSETFGIVSAMLSSKGRNIIGNLIPNPSKENGVVSVSISTVSEEAITVNIYNHVGSRVASYQEFVAEGNNNMQININDLASGTYFINFEGSFGRETRKLVLIK